MGSIAAYKWALVVEGFSGFVEERHGDYKTSFAEFPRAARGRASGIRIDDTILPGLGLTETLDFGFLIRPRTLSRQDILTELHAVIPETMSVVYRVVSEVPRGEKCETQVMGVIKIEDLIASIADRADY